MSQDTPQRYKDRIWILAGAGVVALAFVAGIVQRKLVEPKPNLIATSQGQSVHQSFAPPVASSSGATRASSPPLNQVSDPPDNKPISIPPRATPSATKYTPTSQSAAAEGLRDLQSYVDSEYQYSLQVPKGWVITKTRQGPFWRTSFVGPNNSRILVEVNDQAVSDLAAGWRNLNDRFARAYKDDYRHISIQSVRLAGRDGSCWLFELKKKDQPWLRKCDTAIHVGSRTYALLVEAPIDSYNDLASTFGRVMNSLTVSTADPRTAATSDDYILGARIISEDDLKGKTASELTHMRNEVYARHGYRFHHEDLQEYFGAKAWYHGIEDDVTVVARQLSAIEKSNAATIAKYQTQHNLK